MFEDISKNYRFEHVRVSLRIQFRIRYSSIHAANIEI